jgi:hypothetical protein
MNDPQSKKPGISFQALRASLFLKKQMPSAHTMALLAKLYPNINWRRVSFYEGLPWFTPTVAPYVTAQALPHFYSPGRYCIYLKKFDESRVQCLADLVHEAFHVLQAMHFAKGYGIGFFRGWMLYYIASFIKLGYRNNPFEVPAYDQEFRFLDHCSRQGLHGIEPKADLEALTKVAKQPELIFKNYSYRHTGSFLALVGSFVFCTVVTVVRPVADLLLFVFGWFVKRRQTV